MALDADIKMAYLRINLKSYFSQPKIVHSIKYYVIKWSHCAIDSISRVDRKLYQHRFSHDSSMFICDEMAM